MPINTGYVGTSTTDAQNRTVSAWVFYDSNYVPIGAGQPLINNPSGYCLLVENPDSVDVTIIVQNSSGRPDYVVPMSLLGLPPAKTAHRSLTEMQLAGFSVRGDVSGLLIQTN